jgi:hypothetical protein
VQRTRATLTAIRRGVERLAQGKSVSKAKIAASAPGAAAEPTEGDVAPARRVPFYPLPYPLPFPLPYPLPYPQP